MTSDKGAPPLNKRKKKTVDTSAKRKIKAGGVAKAIAQRKIKSGSVSEDHVSLDTEGLEGPSHSMEYMGVPTNSDAFSTQFNKAWNETVAAGIPKMNIRPAENVRYLEQDTNAIKTKRGFFMTTVKYEVASKHDVQTNPYQQFKDNYQSMEKKIEEKMKLCKNLKVEVKMVAKDEDGNERWIGAKAVEMNAGSNWSGKFFGQMAWLIHHATEMVESAYMWMAASGVAITMTENPPTRGGGFIESPPGLKHHKGIINVRNKDDDCFKYAVCASLYHDKLDHKAAKWRPAPYRKFFSDFDWTGLSFPVSVEEIEGFEKRNSMSVSVFAWAYDDKRIFTIYQTAEKTERHVELILLSEMIDGELRHHYVALTYRGGLNRPQFNHHKYLTCPTCPKCFSKQAGLTKHLITGCPRVTTFQPRILMPGKLKSIVKHWDPAKTKERRHPYFMYADFESLLIPQQDGKVRHVVMSYALTQYIYTHARGTEQFDLRLVMRSEEETNEQFISKFTKDVKDISWQVYRTFTKCEPLKMTAEENEAFKNATECVLCHDKFEKTDVKCRHHEDATGVFVGAAHNLCNLLTHDFNFHNKVLFHNFKNYDSHLIVTGLGPDAVEQRISRSCKFDGKIKALAQNSEKLREITWTPDTSQFTTEEEKQRRKKPSFTIDFKDTAALYPAKLSEAVETLEKVEQLHKSNGEVTVCTEAEYKHALNPKRFGKSSGARL